MQGKKWMERICRRYSEILGEQLTGIYLHGSAAFGCACDASDLDFIVGAFTAAKEGDDCPAAVSEPRAGCTRQGL